MIGSGAGGATAAWALARAGYEVTILEKGRNFFRRLDDPAGLGPPLFGGDEIRALRGFPGMDVEAEPRSFRTRAEAGEGVERSYVGDVNALPTTVGGGTTHWDAKTPRFWRMDFEMRSRFGPVSDADVVDWPFGYDELVPYYETIERVLGVAGDLEATPEFVRREMPRGPYPLPPGPPMYASLVFKEGAERLGYRPHPIPEAICSRPYDGRPVCNNCGYCAGFGCPIHARGGAAVSLLRRALLAGAVLRTRAMVTRIATAPNGRATHVHFLDSDQLRPETLPADHVILAASAIESARLALLSTGPAHSDGLGNRSGRVGCTLCFHVSTFVAGIFAQRLHAYRGRSCSHALLEACAPDTETHLGRWGGLPYLRGGIVEIGGSTNLIDEARLYDELPFFARGRHKSLMRSSPLRDRLLAAQMLGEDLPQLSNRVDLDPAVRDIYELPVARVTYSLHRHDRLASWLWGWKLRKIVKAAGAGRAFFYPAGLAWTDAPQARNTRHLSGTLRMGTDPSRSVTDEFGRIHGAENVVVCDSAVFPTSGAFNPTLTLMAVALRNATALAHGEAQARRGPAPSLAADLPAPLEVLGA
ncbi:MAG: GMC oxidoreductase [Myxococcota bacterium]